MFISGLFNKPGNSSDYITVAYSTVAVQRSWEDALFGNGR
jgi:hypothetical protein